MTTPQWAINRIQLVKKKGAGVLDLLRKNADDQPLFEIPSEVFELGHLYKLDLGGNLLNYLPEDIGRLKNLTDLYLSRNRIVSLPDSLSKLLKLRALGLSGNGLDTFPSVITKLRNLEWLNLSHNLLTRLPGTISHLENLIWLDLTDNHLENLPFEIAQLPHIENIGLKDNPLSTPPMEIAMKGLDPIREYFRQLEGGYDFLYEAKLLILGEGGAGKTTLARKIKDYSYQLVDEQSTEGIDVSQWKFQFESNRIFRVNIWDFGGQEIYHTTHQFFLTKRSLYILVADTRKEDTDFYYWMNVIELLSDNSPLILVKNEKQDRHREINERQLRGQFENLKEIFSTNLATNRGLEKIVNEVQHHMIRLPHVGSALPKNWVVVRETLERDKRNYIPLAEYFDICVKSGFTEMKDSMQLSSYLHDIGVFLHFQDDALLKHIVILKPKWGTDAAYSVLDNKDVIRNLGSFTKNDLNQTWGSPEYIGMHDELLRLMMKFKLCYETPNMNGTYIAPQLLTENQPDYAWDVTDNLYVRYDYEFMPKGILTQFIVTMHPYILKQKYVWRSGVLIEKDKTRGEIIEHYGKREIRVRIAGPHKRELMAIVMHELDKIHTSYKRLKYDKLIPCNCFNCKNSEDPHFYPFERLQKFIEDKQGQIQCQQSYKMVDVRSMVDDAIGVYYRKSEDEYIKKISPIQITVGDNSTVGNIILDSTIRDSLNKASSSNVEPELKEALQSLSLAVAEMVMSLPKQQANEVADDLSKLVDEATKVSPNRKWYEISIEGLTKAAENLGKIGNPVIEIAIRILTLLAAKSGIN